MKSLPDMVDVIVPILQQYNNQSQNIICNIIKSRITGKAKLILDASPHIIKWEDIKKILYANFSDQRNSTQLLNELRSTEFRGSVLYFFNIIQKRLTNLNLKVEQSPHYQQTIRDNQLIALDIMKSNIPEPCRTILFCRNPDAMEKAIFVLTETGHLYHKRDNKFNKRQNKYTN